MNLVDTYEHWLNMALDHVVPKNLCKDWGLPDDWAEDHCNRTLACAACNTFDNHAKPTGHIKPNTFEEFCNVRDAIFVERFKRIKGRHAAERTFFESLDLRQRAAPA